MSSSSDQCQRVFYIAGLGGGRNDPHSGYAFVEAGGEGESLMEESPGLTKNAAKFQALMTVVRCLPPGSEAYVLTDSAILAKHWKGRSVRDRGLRDISQLTSQLIWQKRLTIHVQKIRRSRNTVRELLKELKRTCGQED